MGAQLTGLRADVGLTSQGGIAIRGVLHSIAATNMAGPAPTQLLECKVIITIVPLLHVIVFEFECFFEARCSQCHEVMRWQLSGRGLGASSWLISRIHNPHAPTTLTRAPRHGA